MESGYTALTVYFEDPFWVGLYERWGGGIYEACKITFGAEPKDAQVYGFLLSNWRQRRFSPSMEAEGPAERTINPKRMQRQIRRQMERPAMGTKAQQALKLQQEQGKEARKCRSREEREAEQARKYALRQEKQREKHKGH